VRCLVVGQCIESLLANVEASIRVVDSQNIDGLALISKSPAGSALVRVIAFDGSSTTDVWELGERAKGRVTLSIKT
jgi:hypothetical protein